MNARESGEWVFWLALRFVKCVVREWKNGFTIGRQREPLYVWALVNRLIEHVV